MTSATVITAAHIEQWRSEGVTVVPGFVSEDDLTAARNQIARLYEDDPDIGAATEAPAPASEPTFSPDQFRGIKLFPYDQGPLLNLLGLDHRLLDGARRALGVDQLLMHQNLVQIKRTGLANYEQIPHLDYPLHTILSPGEDPEFHTVIFTIFLTDVTAESGPFCYIPKAHTRQLDTAVTVLDHDMAAGLRGVERRVVCPAGTVLMYSADDIYHRGTNLTATDAERWSITSSFHAARNHFLGGLRWPADGLNKAWQFFVPHADPEQLAAVGVPRPGSAYWSKVTIERARSRYPTWDLTPWRKALDAGGDGT